MGWSIGTDGDRDIGYGVPAICDHPDCSEEIDRGLSYVCGSEPYGGQYGCGLFFCLAHREYSDNEDIRGQFCERCLSPDENGYVTPFEPKPDVEEWIRHKLTDESWQQWRDENKREVEELKKLLESLEAK